MAKGAKRPDFHGARKVMIGCPVPLSAQRKPGSSMRILKIEVLLDSTLPLPKGAPRHSASV